MNKIEKAIQQLLTTKPFYAHFFLNSKIVYDHPQIDTAAASITKTCTVLYFSTKFIENLSINEVCGLVEHEVLHLLFDHVSAEKCFDKHISNLAMDVAINQYIEHLPKEALTLDIIEKSLNQKLETLQSWEYYYSKMLQQKDKFVKHITLDDHGTMEELKQKIEEARKAGSPVLKVVIEKAVKASAGNVPNAVLKVLDSLRVEHRLPWQQILSNFVARCLSTTKLPTRKKENRRFGLDQPGKKKKRELTLSVCVDSSGSISDESYEMFMAELMRIVKLCTTVYFIDADCVVQHVETIKKNKKFEPTRRGSGGTAYQPAIDKALELRSDAIVYFGDFDCADKPTDPGIPFLWVGVGSSPKPGDFGGEVRL